MDRIKAEVIMLFDIAIERVLSHEGGYTSGDNDPGGETKWGISKRSYPNVDIKNLTREGAKAIYKRDFWARIHADTLPDGVAFQLLDFAVNAGMSVAIKNFQKILGVAQDGIVGPKTIEASNHMDPLAQIVLLNVERLEHYTTLSTWTYFSKGWVKRITQNLRYGISNV